MDVSEAVITIPMDPPRELNPNHHAHWSGRASAARMFRTASLIATAEALRNWSGAALEPLVAGAVMDVEIAWSGRRKVVDDDNAWAMLKPCRDGIADLLYDGEDRHMSVGRLSQVRGTGCVTVRLRPEAR